MGENGRADDDLAAGVALAIGFLFRGDESQALSLKLILPAKNPGELVIKGFAGSRQAGLS